METREIPGLPHGAALFGFNPDFPDERADSLIEVMNEKTGYPLGRGPIRTEATGTINPGPHLVLKKSASKPRGLVATALRKDAGSDDVLAALEDKQAEYPRTEFDWIDSAQADATSTEQVRDQSLTELPVDVNRLEAQLEAMRTAFAEAEGRWPDASDTNFVEAASTLIQAHVNKGTAVNKSRTLVGAAIRSGPRAMASRVEMGEPR
jgi:hypothetical protein